jgi:hypothetical protein
MRTPWLLFLVACGGSAPPPQAPVSNTGSGSQPPAPVGLSNDVCRQRSDDFGPVPLRAEQVALRRGTGVKKLADIVSTREAPIEVCMPDGERAWLEATSCGDGSKPAFQRTGSIGPGGTCGSVIDLYAVTCPEKQYEVFMDMYMCPPGKGI